MDTIEGHGYENNTFLDHLIVTYSGMNLYQVYDMDYLDYLSLRRDAFINYLEKTEGGRQYLLNASRLKETKPNRRALRDTFGKEK